MTLPHCTKLPQRKALGLVTHDNTGGPYVVECQGCGEVYPSFHCLGGEQIADTGDHEDARCPHCDQIDPEECDNAGLAWNTQQLKINELQLRLNAADQRIDELTKPQNEPVAILSGPSDSVCWDQDSKPAAMRKTVVLIEHGDLIRLQGQAMPVTLASSAYSDMHRANERLGQCLSCGEVPEDDGVITHDPGCTFCAMELSSYANFEQPAPVAVLPDRSPEDYAIEHAEYMAKSADGVLAKFQAYGLALLAVDEGGDDGEDEGELFEAIDSTRQDLQESLVDLRGMVYEFRKRSNRCAPL